LAKNCQVYQWPIILGSGFHTTYRGERVLVVITLDATFLLLKRYCKKYVPLSWTMQKVWKRMVAHFDAIRFMGVGRIFPGTAKNVFPGEG